MQFKMFENNGNHSIYSFNYPSTKKRKKIEGVRFLAKIIAIYFNKKIVFDSMNNDGGGEFAYFWLADN